MAHMGDLQSGKAERTNCSASKASDMASAVAGSCCSWVWGQKLISGFVKLKELLLKTERLFMKQICVR